MGGQVAILFVFNPDPAGKLRIYESERWENLMKWYNFGLLGLKTKSVVRLLTTCIVTGECCHPVWHSPVYLPEYLSCVVC